jgi:hypothetical protein
MEVSVPHRTCKALKNAFQDITGTAQVCFSDCGSHLLSPRALRCLDGVEYGSALWQQAQELGAAVRGVVVERGQPLVGEDVGNPLHALAGETQPARDFGYGSGLILHRGKDLPASARLSERPGKVVPRRREESSNSQYEDGEPAEGLRGRRTGRRSLVIVDSMLSIS